MLNVNSYSWQNGFENKNTIIVNTIKSNIYKYVLEQDMVRDQPLEHMINDIVGARLLDNGDVIMSYIANESERESTAQFTIIATIFR